MGEWLTHGTSDLSRAARSLARVPGFTAVAIFTLAVGLGGTAAIYTLLDRVVLDPLPYPESERLVRLDNQVPGVGPDEVWSLSTAQWVHYTDHAETLEEVGLYRGGGGNMITAGGPLRATSVRVTASVMAMLGAEARAGRLLTSTDDEPGAPVVALVSFGFWTQVLASDPDVVGTSLTYNDEPIEVVGVLEPGLTLPGWSAADTPDLWFAMQIDRGGGFGNSHVFPAIGRLAPGQTTENAEAEMVRLRAQLPEAFPQAYTQRFFDAYGFRTRVTPLKDDVVGDLAGQLWILFGGVGLVLLIACANVTNLFLVRMEGKRRELAIRTALGADRSTIGRYLVSEALVLAVVGGALAVGVGFWGVPALATLAPDELPRVHGVTMGVGTVLLTTGLALLAAIAIAALPLLGARDTHDVLADSSRGSTVGRGRQRARSGLVIMQMALAVTLVVGASLLLETLRTLGGADTGMDAAGAVAVDIYMNPQRHPTDADLWAQYQRMNEEISRLPGVVAVGLGSEVPVSGGYGCTVQGFEDDAVYDRIEQAGMTTCAGQTFVTPGYFDALGVPVLEGRALDAADHADPRRGSVVVSKAFADRFWPGESAIGRGVGPSGRTVEPWFRVVGVVDDVARASDPGRPPLSQNAIAIYYPILDNPAVEGRWFWWPGYMTLVVRTGLDDPLAIMPDIRRTVASVDPELPVANPRALTDVVDEALADLAFVSLLLGIAAAVALLLAAVGLYGVIAYVISQRTREIGMRLAIGARPGEVVREIVRRTLGLAALGLAVGVPISLISSRAIQSMLVGVERTDPLAYLVAGSTLFVVAVAASWIPAHRAASIDPVDALRSE